MNGKGGGSNPSEHFSVQSSGDASQCAFHNTQKLSQKRNHNGHYEELSRAGSGHGDDRLWRLWKGAGPEVIPLMDPRSLALGKRLFICQDVKNRLSGNAVSISPDFRMGHLVPSGYFCLVLLPGTSLTKSHCGKEKWQMTAKIQASLDLFHF